MNSVWLLVAPYVRRLVAGHTLVGPDGEPVGYQVVQEAPGSEYY